MYICVNMNTCTHMHTHTHTHTTYTHTHTHTQYEYTQNLYICARTHKNKCLRNIKIMYLCVFV